MYYSEKHLLVLIPSSPQVGDFQVVFLASHHQKVVTEQREETNRILDDCHCHHHQKLSSQWSEEVEVGKSDKSGYIHVL